MTSSHAKVAPMATKIMKQIFALKGVINFQVEFGVLWNDTCMLTLKNGQIKFRGEITLILMIIKYILTYACNDYYINIIIAKEF